MKRQPPIIMRLGTVSRYIWMNYGRNFSKAHVRDWVKNGIGQESLETRIVRHKHFRVLATTDKWVDEFIERTGICK